MKTFAHYDSNGVVRALVAVEGPDHINAALVPQSGHSSAEIEGLQLDISTQDVQHVRKVAKELRVQPARVTR